MNKIVFRWAVWGSKYSLIDTLRYSIGSFRHYFGETGLYLVCTDEPNEIAALLGHTVEIANMKTSRGRKFYETPANSYWRKLCPAPRLFPGVTEVFVDSDVFLVGDPYELRGFCTV